MKIESVVIITVMIAMLVAPFIFFVIHERRRKKEKLNALMDLAKREQAQITDFDISGRIALGFDTEKKMVFLLKMTDVPEKSYVMNLGDVLSCSVESRHRVKDIDRSISNLYLNFTLRDEKSTVVKWPLFILEDDLQLGNEFSLAGKWARMINANLESPVPRSKTVMKMRA